MERIVYISTAQQPIVSETVGKILGQSRLNNQRDGLTGLLIVGGRRFLQVIEGERAPLEAAYRRISADPRHFALVLLERRPISSRSFPNWDMGHIEAGTASGETLATMVGRLTEGVEEPNLRAHLRSFAELHSQAA